MAIQKIKVFI